MSTLGGTAYYPATGALPFSADYMNEDPTTTITVLTCVRPSAWPAKPLHARSQLASSSATLRPVSETCSGRKSQATAGKGRTLLAYTTNNKQSFAFRLHDHTWHPIDHESLTPIHRPTERFVAFSSLTKTGWSKASQWR